ncbi:PHP domain-containing protein, partial [Patescibacteria group bacterium]|nr:PHP domain-containing protein [Patescibacteria group bacterium]
MSNFVHLHVHSHYSLLDGLPKIKELVKAAKARGFSALALTDHGNMYGAIEFYQACLKEGIKPIVGVEAYVAPGSRFEKDQKDRYYHQLLLAMDYMGYRNLMKLVSLSHLEGFYYKPRMDKEILKQYHEGLVASTACLGGEIPWILRKENNYEKAKKVALEYQDIFGKDNFFLELMDIPALEGQMEVNTKLIQLSKDTGIPMTVTRDVHYLNPDDDEAQDILTCIRDGNTIDNTARKTMVGIDVSFAKGDDIAGRFRHVKEAIENTAKIAERANLQLELNKWHFANVDLPAGKTDNEYLSDQVYERLVKLMEITDEVRKRADYELGIITTKGYSPYFLAVADYVSYARANGIIETTRGS